MQQEGTHKAGIPAILTPHFYTAEMFGDFNLDPVGISAGFAMTFNDYGDADSFPNINDNLAGMALIGASYKSEHIQFRAGYLIGAYSLWDTVYNPETELYESSLDFFNYGNIDTESGTTPPLSNWICFIPIILRLRLLPCVTIFTPKQCSHGSSFQLMPLLIWRLCSAEAEVFTGFSMREIKGIDLV
jgi:hypothetical protein